jgi:hypothetical protein
LFAQTSSKKNELSLINRSSQETYKSSPAFAEIILRKTELDSELESLLVSYTEEFPKVKEIRFESDSLKKAIERLSTVKSADSSKLTLALGKLMIRKAELETDLWNLRKKYDDNHAEVKRAKRKIEIYEASIREILD